LQNIYTPHKTDINQLSYNKNKIVLDTWNKNDINNSDNINNGDNINSDDDTNSSFTETSDNDSTDSE